MDYEKKYKELVAKIKNAHLYAQTDSTKNVLEGILPELAESEDERILEIIKHCIESRYLHTSTIKGISQKQCFAWLEKQGDKKPFDYENANIQQKDFAPKIEPKFKIGDWVIDKQGIVHQIANVVDIVTCHTYGYDIVGGGGSNNPPAPRLAHHWRGIIYRGASPLFYQRRKLKEL